MQSRIRSMENRNPDPVEGEMVETQGLTPQEAETRTKLPVDTVSMLSSLPRLGSVVPGLGYPQHGHVRHI